MLTEKCGICDGKGIIAQKVIEQKQRTMSVRTTADEKRDQLKDKMDETLVLLGECQELLFTILNKDTWGSNDYRSEYISKLEDVELEVFRVRGSLNKINRSL